MGIGTQAWLGINFNKVQFFRTNVSDEPDRPQVLINAQTGQVKSTKNHMSGNPTYREVSNEGEESLVSGFPFLWHIALCAALFEQFQ